MRKKSVRNRPQYQHKLRFEPLEERALLSEYSFVRIAYDTSFGCCGKSADVSMNDDGVVAFTVFELFPTTNRQVLLGDGGPLQVVAETNETTFQSPVINQEGSTTFTTGNNAQGDAKSVYKDIGWPQHPLLTQNETFSSFGESVSSNDEGVVAFRATLTDGGDGIYSLHEQSLVPFLESRVRREFSQPAIGNPSINNAGDVAFTAFNGVYYGPAGALEVLQGDLQLPRIEVLDSSTNEGNDSRQAAISIDVSGLFDWDSTETITVHYTTIDGSATAGEDYEGVSGTASFGVNPDGSRQLRVTVPVTIVGDEIAESSEYFLFQVSQVSDNGGMPHAVISNGTAVVRISDDDRHPGGPELCNGRPKAIPRVSMTTRGDITEGDEGDRELTLVLGLTRSSCFPNDPVTVEISTTDDTARRGEDYELTPSTVTFPPGVSASQAINVVVHGDIEPEGASFGEKFLVHINASNALLAHDVAVVHILNDDGTVQVPAQQVDVNDSGAVIFSSVRRFGNLGDERSVYIATSDQVTEIADSTATFHTFSPNPDLRTVAINNSGQVAFYASLDDGRTGIFTGPDPVANKVVVEGDSIQGLQVWKVIPTVDINSHGAIAFAVWHDEDGGTVGIYRTTSSSVCDPSAIPSLPSSASGFDWSMDLTVSEDDGLVLNDVALGGRAMARQISLPYLKVQTSIMAEPVRVELKPCSNEATGRSRLTSAQVEVQEHLAIQAVYEIDNLAPGSASTLRVTQRYEFERANDPAKDPTKMCEPSGEFWLHRDGLVCARFFPKVSYEFVSRNGETLTLVNAAERLHFQIDDSAASTSAIFQDCDSFVGCVVHRGLIFREKRNPVRSELSGSAIIAGAPGQWDSFHQTSKAVLKEPSGPIPGPGCPECVHIHWRWPEGFDSPQFNEGLPIIPTGSNQTVDFAILRGSTNPDELDPPQGYLSLVNNEPIHRADQVFWYSATGFLASDEFFIHGGFFEPPQEIRDFASDLEVRITPVPSDVQPLGLGQAQFRLTALNHGPDSTPARISLRSSKGASMDPIGSTDVQCSPDKQAFICTTGNLWPGTSTQFNIVVAAPEQRKFRLMAVASGYKKEDPVSNNNKANVKTAILVSRGTLHDTSPSRSSSSQEHADFVASPTNKLRTLTRELFMSLLRGAIPTTWMEGRR